MAQWGNTDDAANSVLWATTAVNLTPNTTNQTNLFNNTTMGAWYNNGVSVGQAVGQFAVDVNEIHASGNSSIANYYVSTGGTGYGTAPTVTVANTSGGANTTIANSTITSGKVTALTANGTQPGGYATAPSVTIAAPAAINITANSTGFSNTTDTLTVTSASSKFSVGDRLYYSVPTNNTAIAPLTGNTYYYVSFANSTKLAISTTLGGANVDLTDNRTTNPAETHTIQGDTATGFSALSGVKPGAAHTGWILRTVGSGGRAGRVQDEVLVAMGGNFSTDSEDTVYPDN